MEDTIKIAEAAKLLDIKPETLRAAIRQKAFPFATHFLGDGGGSVFVISRRGLMLWLEYGYLPEHVLAILAQKDLERRGA